MKTILSMLFFYYWTSITVYSQSLSKEEFDIINNQVREIIFSSEYNKDISFLLKKLDINDKFLDINNNLKANPLDYKENIIFPFYQENENKLLLTIYSFTQFPETEDKDLSGLGKANYHFVIESLVSLDKDSVIFTNQRVLDSKTETLKWYLNAHKNYMTITNPIHTKYGFIPPPPPPIPDSLEYSPFHLDAVLNKHLDEEDWSNAEIVVNKLINLYPNDPLSYYKKGYIKIYTKRIVEGCEDIEKSSFLGLSQKYPHHTEHFNKMKNICNLK